MRWKQSRQGSVIMETSVHLIKLPKKIYIGSYAVSCTHETFYKAPVPPVRLGWPTVDTDSTNALVHTNRILCLTNGQQKDHMPREKPKAWTMEGKRWWCRRDERRHKEVIGASVASRRPFSKNFNFASVSVLCMAWHDGGSPTGTYFKGPFIPSRNMA